MSTILVTGSSSGLGLELVKQFASAIGEHGLVIATARKCSPEMNDVLAQANGHAMFVALDILDESSLKESVAEVQALLKQRSLDILINCAGTHAWMDGKVAQMSVRQFQKLDSLN